MSRLTVAHYLQVEEHHWTHNWGVGLQFMLMMAVLGLGIVFVYRLSPSMSVTLSCLLAFLVAWLAGGVMFVASIWWEKMSLRVFQSKRWPAPFRGYTDVIVRAEGIHVVDHGLIPWHDIKWVRANPTDRRFWIRRTGRYRLVSMHRATSMCIRSCTRTTRPEEPSTNRT